MVKTYLNKLLVVLVACLFFIVTPVQAESYSDLFIKITDATTAVRDKDQEKAHTLVAEIKEEFLKKANHDSKAGKEVQKSLDLKGEITEKQLVTVSTSLLAFEKEQNPVDLDAEKEKLETRLQPYFEKLQEAITAKDLQATRKAYADLNNTWTRNEAVVRDHSTAYYGKVETAISFLRSAIETEPTNFDSIQSSYNDLKNVLDQFISGEKIEETSSNLTLSDGIKLLKKALNLFQANDTSQASQVMKEFITIWPTIEGDVSTTNPSLYTRVESQSPVIMVKGKESKYQKQLEALISDLSAIDTTASYSAVDSMLILLREGVEALLIVMALVTVLKSAKLVKGLKWVYAGALLGILASAAIAVALQFLFPAVTSASNREVIEGAVGIIAVGMMIVIGIWLHRKSSVQKWNQFMESQMKAVTATGSFISMFALSFLAVFREGAETILFYVGILPRIRSFDFFLGIGLALAVLAILAILMTKASRLVKPHKIFFILTWMIYALAFKMLGVSLHALQLTNMLPNHILSNFPTIDWAGIYPSWEVLACQVLFVLIVGIVTVKQHEK
ncbi:FTR1 family iron permease [Streptococcus australis]|uniref:FTR1 family iron permease n=1 Tax=Streptococcus TaxID=1301 RepID=UPI00100FAFBF|nr:MULTISPECIES: FTR1 family protein [Streptococcus]MBS4897926.1 FTR1 family protein [Streptococcus sp.]RXV55101.1 FTR1 family iron permease [Streptococcus australis]